MKIAMSTLKEIIGFKGYEEDIKYNDFPYKESRLYIPQTYQNLINVMLNIMKK